MWRKHLTLKIACFTMHIPCYTTCTANHITRMSQSVPFALPKSWTKTKQSAGTNFTSGRAGGSLKKKINDFLHNQVNHSIVCVLVVPPDSDRQGGQLWSVQTQLWCHKKGKKRFRKNDSFCMTSQSGWFVPYNHYLMMNPDKANTSGCNIWQWIRNP